jgi:hypothetical protein
VLRRIRNQYQHEVCEVVRDLRGRTQSETFLRRQDVHHIELEYLVRQPLELSALTYALRDGKKHELPIVPQFLAQPIEH